MKIEHLNKTKNIIFVIIISLLLLSCNFDKANQTFVTEKMGLNIEVGELKYRSLEKKEENDMEFRYYDYEILNKDEILYKNDYPKRSYSNEETKSKTWNKTSFSENDKNLDIVRNYEYTVTGLKSEVEKMLEALREEGNIYSYSYLEVDKEIVDIQLFVVDVNNSEYYVYEIFSH